MGWDRVTKGKEKEKEGRGEEKRKGEGKGEEERGKRIWEYGKGERQNRRKN